jgi:hypothetical protein
MHRKASNQGLPTGGRCLLLAPDTCIAGLSRDLHDRQPGPASQDQTLEDETRGSAGRGNTGGRQVIEEPVTGMHRRLGQGPGFFEQVGGTLDDGQAVGAA